ncbi:1,4-beta-xylanase [Streptomyces triticirhizae]|uniref:1,4-beta-xylanase n=1 Tax=Streptomyces triticirhizae TaxID=2483353 RepID=A0A3M2M2R5_9ACTN|nr:1,4-beta-xylanase [Streptomyces triticirhizae]
MLGGAAGGLAAATLAGTAFTGTASGSTGGPRPHENEYGGYLFSYFTGEGSENGEQVYFALSEGNDPLRWRQLNSGAPVLRSDVGTGGVRDPFILRSPDGGRFYQIATDLRIHGNGDWDGAQRHGSRAIVVWESDDLVDWSAPRLAMVSPEAAGNTWAPEATWDAERNVYVVYWASKLYDNPDHTGDSYNRMLYATTTDFVSFTEARVWIDRGWSVIDSTVIQHNGVYQRFSKDERGADDANPYGKMVFQEQGTALTGEWTAVREGIGHGAISSGEGPLVFRSNTEERWYLFIDEYGGRGYVPFETTDLASGDWRLVTDHAMPGSPRHGTVLPVTTAEYDRLLAAYGG